MQHSIRNILASFGKTKILFADSPALNSKLIRTRLIGQLKHQLCYKSDNRISIKPLQRKFPIEKHTWDNYLANAPQFKEELLRTENSELLIWMRTDKSSKRIKLQALFKNDQQKRLKPCSFAVSELEPIPVDRIRHYAPIIALFILAQLPVPKKEKKNEYRSFAQNIRKLCCYLDQELSVPSENMPASFTLTLKKLQAWAWTITGAIQKDTAKLGRAIRACDTILKGWKETGNELEYGQILSNLSFLSLNYAHCVSGIEAYEQSLDNIEKAQSVFTRVKYPFLWAQLQEIKSEAQISLGERYNDTEYLETSIHTLHTIKRVWTSLDNHERLASIQKNIGDVLYKLGRITPGTERLEQASSAYHGAINAYQLIQKKQQVNHTRLALAQTLVDLGERSGSRERLEEAVQLANTAKKHLPRKTALGTSCILTEAHALTRIGCQYSKPDEPEPLLLKAIGNLNDILKNSKHINAFEKIHALDLRGTALGFMGAIRKSEIVLEESSENFRQAIEIIKNAGTNCSHLSLPSQILGRLYSQIARNTASIAKHSADTIILKRAEEAYKIALHHTDQEKMSRDWAVLQSELADIQIFHAKRQNGHGSALLDEAIQSCHQALSALKRDRAPTLWAQMKNKLAEALTLSGAMGGGTPCLELAVEAYNKVLEDWKPGLSTMDRATTLNNMANVLADIARREVNGQKLEQARQAFSEAYDLYSSLGHTSFAERVHDNISAIDELIDNDFRVNTTLVFAHTDTAYGNAA